MFLLTTDIIYQFMIRVVVRVWANARTWVRAKAGTCAKVRVQKISSIRVEILSFLMKVFKISLANSFLPVEGELKQVYSLTI